MWLTFPTVNVTNGSDLVTIVGGHSTAQVKPGDAFMVGNVWHEVEQVLTTSLVLRTPYSGTSGSSVLCHIIPTATDFNAAAEVLRDATDVTANNFEAMERWWTQTGTVTFTGYDGAEYTVKTAKQIELDMGTPPDEQTISSNTTLTKQPSHLRVNGIGPVAITTPSTMHVNGLSFYLSILSQDVTLVTISDGVNVNTISKHASNDDVNDKTGLYLVMYSNGRWHSSWVSKSMS